MNIGVLLIVLWHLLADVCWASARPWRLSIDGLRTFEPRQNGYRPILENIPRQDPYSFFFALDLYMEEESNLNRLKIMRGWYEQAGREPYNLLALAFLYNAWDPNSRLSTKAIREFIHEHFHEPRVLSLFIYRLRPLAERGILSFTHVSEDLLGIYSHPRPEELRDRRGLMRSGSSAKLLVFHELEGLHYLDTSLHAEISPSTQTRVTSLLLEIWQRHKRLRSQLYLRHSQWFEKVIGFYQATLRQSEELLAQSMKSRRSLFCDHGYCDDQVLVQLENLFLVQTDSPLIPDFLPKVQSQQIQPKSTNSNKRD